MYISTYFVCSTLRVILQGFVDPIMQQNGWERIFFTHPHIDKQACVMEGDANPQIHTEFGTEEIDS